MSNQRPLDSLHSDLIRRGLPVRYVRRMVEELEDHQQDMVNEQPGIVNDSASRLGNLTDLADRIVAEFRAARFVGRHPVLAFVLTPLPLVVVMWMAVFFVAALLSWLLEESIGRTGRCIGAYAIYLGLRFVPFTVAALVVCRSAYRSGQGGWSFVACALIALLAGSLVATFTFPVGDEEGRLMFGTLFLTPGIATTPFVVVARQLAQMAVPLAIWLCFSVRFERRRRLAIRTANLSVAS